MNNKLADFIVDLAVNPDRARRFSENAKAELVAAGLSEADGAALLSKDTDRVRTALGNSFADHMTQFSDGGRAKGSKGAGRKKAGGKKAGGKKARAKGGAKSRKTAGKKR